MVNRKKKSVLFGNTEFRANLKRHRTNRETGFPMVAIKKKTSPVTNKNRWENCLSFIWNIKRKFLKSCLSTETTVYVNMSKNVQQLIQQNPNLLRHVRRLAQPLLNNQVLNPPQSSWHGHHRPKLTWKHEKK